MTDRLLPDGRTHADAVDAYLEIVRLIEDDDDESLIGANAIEYGRELDTWLACIGDHDPIFSAIAEAYWRHFEELNP